MNDMMIVHRRAGISDEEMNEDHDHRRKRRNDTQKKKIVCQHGDIREKKIKNASLHIKGEKDMTNESDILRVEGVTDMMMIEKLARHRTENPDEMTEDHRHRQRGTVKEMKSAPLRPRNLETLKHQARRNRSNRWMGSNCSRRVGRKTRDQHRILGTSQIQVRTAKISPPHKDAM